MLASRVVVLSVGTSMACLVGGLFSSALEGCEGPRWEWSFLLVRVEVVAWSVAGLVCLALGGCGGPRWE